MNWPDGVAARLTGLSLDTKGRPTVQLLAADAVRCGLLMDLALAGRLVLTDESVAADAAPTGFPPADDLLTAIRSEPERALDAWFADRRIGLHRFIDELVDTGSWDVRRTLLGQHRYRAKNEARVDRDKHWDLTLASSVWAPEDPRRSATASRSSSNRPEYTSRVIAAEACPRRR